MHTWANTNRAIKNTARHHRPHFLQYETREYQIRKTFQSLLNVPQKKERRKQATHKSDVGDQSEPVWERKKRLICIVWELIKTCMCAQDKWLKWIKGSVLWLRIQPGFQTETETCVAPSWQLFMIINSNRVTVSLRYPESRADFWWGVRCDFHPELEDRGDCWPSHFHSFPP